MSAKNLDKHNRFRSITVGFRVSPEEHEHINVAVALSGLSKQEYCYRRCLGRDIVVQGNPKVYKALKDQLAAVLDELKRIEAGARVDDELLENINLIKHTCQVSNCAHNRRLGVVTYNASSKMITSAWFSRHFDVQVGLLNR